MAEETKKETQEFKLIRLMNQYRSLPDADNNYRDYDEFVYKCFNYLNGKVNKKLIETCNIPDIYSNPPDIHHHGNTYNSVISIFTANILKVHFEDGIDIIKTNMLILVCHELMHSTVISDQKKYNRSIRYCNTIELEVNLRVAKFIIDNYEDIVIRVYDKIDINFIKRYFTHLNKLNNRRKTPIVYTD